MRILLNPQTFLSGYTFRPHAFGESHLRIRKPLNLLSRMETFESDTFLDTCGRSSPDTFESDDVARSGLVSSVVSTAWLQNNMAAKQNVLAVLVVLISSLVTSVQLNVAMLTVHFNYIKRGVLDTRVNPDTCGRADSICTWIRVDAETFQSRKKSLRI